MKEICKTGGVVNAYNAVKMAEKIMNLKYLKSQIRKLKIHTSKPGSAKTIEN